MISLNHYKMKSIAAVPMKNTYQASTHDYYLA